MVTTFIKSRGSSSGTYTKYRINCRERILFNSYSDVVITNEQTREVH